MNGLKQDIITSGSRLGGGSMRWCATDAPFNATFPWEKAPETYPAENTTLILKYTASNYVGTLAKKSATALILCF